MLLLHQTCFHSLLNHQGKGKTRVRRISGRKEAIINADSRRKKRTCGGRVFSGKSSQEERKWRRIDGTVGPSLMPGLSSAGCTKAKQNPSGDVMCSQAKESDFSAEN